MKFRYLYSFFILLFPNASISQINLDSLFLNIKENACTENIIKSLENDKNFKNIKYDNNYTPTYLFANPKLDKYYPDSIKILLSNELESIYWVKQTWLSQEVEIERYYSDYKLVHKAYNEILEILLGLEFEKSGAMCGYGNKDGSVIDLNDQNLDLLSTGFSFISRKLIHRVRLGIKYDNENIYCLSITSIRKNIDCD